MLMNDKVHLIREKALWMRRTAFAMVHRAQVGHPGGGFWAPGGGFWAPGGGFYAPGGGFYAPGGGYSAPGGGF